MFSHWFPFILFSIILTSLPSALCNIDISAQFGPSLSPNAKIIAPSTTIASPTIENATQRWTLHDAPTYFGAVKVATEGDVGVVVRIASALGVPFLATGGGHGTTVTLGGIRQGLEIDLSGLKTVDLDAGTNQLTIGGGVIFSDVIPTLYNAGKEMPIGTATCVGIIGATLGGGVSSLEGLHGLLIDTLVSVRLVTAAGNAITVSKTQNPDLFWALRGAGANFGVVTSATYNVFDATNGGQVTSANFEYFGAANQSIFGILKTLDEGLPANLAINVAVQYSPQYNQSGFIVNANYFGSQTDALPYLQPFIDLHPVLQTITTLPWTGVFADAYFGLDKTGCSKGQYINAYSIAIKQTDVGTLSSVFANLQSFSRANPDIAANFVIHRFPNQAAVAVADAETAYAYRDIKAHIQLECAYAPNNTALENTVNAFSLATRNQIQPMSGYPDLAVYLGFAHGDEGPSVWYTPGKLGRLSALKRQWDPKGVFSFYNAVPLR